MSIYVTPKDDVLPNDLLIEIDDFIGLGEARTWKVNPKGNYTHSATQYIYKASFKHELTLDGTRLVFKLAWPKGKMTQELYSVYHGRFVEFLLSNFESYISEIEIKNKLKKVSQ